MVAPAQAESAAGASAIAPFLAPPVSPLFLERTTALEQMTAAVGRGLKVLLTGAHGSVGVGRTVLAAQFAHSLRGAFPDGVLWLSGAPFDPYLLALRLAAALGEDPTRLAPPGDAARALDALLAGRRVLIVLDEVSDPRVLALLPPIGPTVIFTSRDSSPASAVQAEVVQVGAFVHNDAERYLQRLVGPERWQLEPVAIRDVAAMLGYHPLAMNLALGPLVEAGERSGPVASILARSLRARLARLQRFSLESRWAGAAFACTLEALDPPERSFLHALSALPTSGFSLEAATAVGQVTTTRADSNLERFSRLSLVQRIEQGRFALHPLVGDLSRGIGALEELRSKAAAFYLSHCLSQMDDAGAIDREIDGILASMAWAMDKGEARLVKDFALALGPYFDQRGYREEVPRRLQWGLAAARASNDQKAESRVNRWLGRMFARRGSPETARERLEAAVTIAADSGDAAAMVAALLDLGRLEIEQGQLEVAIRALEDALKTTGGRMSDEGRVLLELGRALARAGRLADATRRLEAVIAWATRKRDRQLEEEARAELEAMRPPPSAPPAREEVSAVVARLEEATRPPIKVRPPIHDPLPEPPAHEPAIPELPLPELLRPLVDATPSPQRIPIEGTVQEQVETLEALATVQIQRGNHAAAEQTLLQGAHIAETVGDRPKAAGMLEQVGKLMVARGEISQALSSYEKSFRLREAIGDLGGAAKTLHQMGRVATEVGDYDGAMYHFLRGLDRTEALEDEGGRAEALFRLGVIFAARGDYDDAVAHYEVSEELWLEARNLQGVAAVLQAIGRVHAHQGRREQAAACYQRSLELAEALEDDRLRATGLHQLGLLATDSGDFQEGMHHYRRSLGLKRAVGDLRGMAATLHAMALLEAARGRAAEARRYYQRVLEIADGLGAMRVKAATLRALGDVAAAEGQLEAAGRDYEQAAALQAALGEKREIAAINHGMGTVKAEQGDLEEALTLLRRSIAISRELGDQRGIAATLYQIGVVLAEQDRDDEAMEHLQESLAIDEGLGNQRGVAITMAMLGQILAIDGQIDDAKALFRQAAARMETLKMPEADTVRGWLEGRT